MPADKDKKVKDPQYELFPTGEVVATKEVEKKVFLRAKNSVLIRTEPSQLPEGYSLQRADFVTAKRSDYLLIGFDTEYQALEYTQKEIKEKKAKYEVLSYQFYADDRAGRNWSGIAIPDTKARISLADFLTFVFAEGVRQGQKIPSTIILVGHYNRADIPAFGGREELWTRLSNVRNSLVTPGVPIRLRFTFGDSDDDDDYVEVKVYLRDTMLLAPAGQKALSILGGLIGVEKVSLADDPETELLYKKNMKALRDHDFPKFKRYAIRDAEVSALYFEKIAGIYREVTGKDFVPTTLSAIGPNLLIKDWKERGLEPLTMVGREFQAEVVWNPKRAVLQPKNTTPYIEEFSWHAGFITECYHGGRNEQFWFGPSHIDDWSDYDLASAYPTAMALMGRPRWHEIREMTADDFGRLTIDEFGFANVEFKFPKSVRYPTLPVRSNNGIIFPRSGYSYCAAPEIVLARELGCELRLRRGVIIPHGQNCEFLPFIKDSIAKRRSAKSEIEKQFWKEVCNSCYGKTAQGLQEKRAFSLSLKKGQKLPESDITNPAYASYVTSFVRAVCGEIMNAIPSNKMVFSVTTDGFNTNASEQEMAEASSGKLAQRYRETTNKLSGDPILKIKHSVRQVLGWKTRGQATLLPGTREGVAPIVLAKAGIRPDIWATEPAEENDWIVKKFFERDGATEFEMDVLTSMREIILYDADLVSKKVKKKIPMEYDFKRRPRSVGTMSVTLPSGERFEHLAFDTEPFDDIEEFQTARGIWDKYRTSQEFCLKTERDFREFADYMAQTRALTDESRKYLRLNDASGLQRFRRDLCKAFKKRRAGFEYYPALSNSELCEILNDAGFGDSAAFVKVHHLENGDKGEFEPHATIPTLQVMAVMGKLKRRLKLLRPDEFLGELPALARQWINISETPLRQPASDG